MMYVSTVFGFADDVALSRTCACRAFQGLHGLGPSCHARGFSSPDACQSRSQGIDEHGKDFVIRQRAVLRAQPAPPGRAPGAPATDLNRRVSPKTPYHGLYALKHDTQPSLLMTPPIKRCVLLGCMMALRRALPSFPCKRRKVQEAPLVSVVILCMRVSGRETQRTGMRYARRGCTGPHRFCTKPRGRPQAASSLPCAWPAVEL